MVSIKVAKSLYTDENDAAEAMERVEAFRQSRRPTAVPGSALTQTQHNTNAIGGSLPGGDTYGLGRSKAAVTSSFKEEEKFNGSVSGKIPLHRIKNRFLDALRDQAIPKSDEVYLLHCCLSGMALDFYYKSIRGICQNTEEAFKALERQFNSYQHQAQARTYLKKLSITAVVKEKTCSTMVALETIHSRITETAPNCGQEYQHYVHYCDFLEGAVSGQPWAEAVIQERLTPNPNERFDYNTFYSKLCAALTSYESTRTQEPDQAGPNDFNPASTFFGERYASKPPRGRTLTYRAPIRGPPLNVTSMLRPPNRIKKRMSASQLAQLKARTKCLNCQKTGHWRHECPNKSATPMQDVVLFLVAKMGNDETAVAKTLWAMAEDDDEYFAYVAFSTNETGDTSGHTYQMTSSLSNTFQALINAVPDNQSYDEQDANNELQNIYEEFCDQFISSAASEEPSNFGPPMRR